MDRHKKIPIEDITESPKEGIYITKADMQKYRLFALIVSGIIGLSFILSRKK